MPEALTEAELTALARHARRTWVVFIGFWVFTVAAVLAIEFLGLPGWAVNGLMLAVLAGVGFAVWLQFSVRCPRCGANLGWQVRLGIPDTCRRCGVAMRK